MGELNDQLSSMKFILEEATPCSVAAALLAAERAAWFERQPTPAPGTGECVVIGESKSHVTWPDSSSSPVLSCDLQFLITFLKNSLVRP